MIAADLFIGVYLVLHAVRRAARNKPAVLAVQVLLILCAAAVLILRVVHPHGGQIVKPNPAEENGLWAVDKPRMSDA